MTGTSSSSATSLDALKRLRIKIFADVADKASMLDLYGQSFVRGFTTNPSLMRQAGVRDFVAFAREVLAAVPDLPISFEVFADEFSEMERQAKIIASWGDNVYVKVPVMNTRRQPSYDLVHRLSHGGLRINATAVMELEQIHRLAEAMSGGAPAIISVFAGRIADTGRDPVPIVAEGVQATRQQSQIEILWASTREILNIFQAEQAGCHIITLTRNVLAQLARIGKPLNDYSLETVEMFANDARSAGYVL
jgi:transaldolase